MSVDLEIESGVATLRLNRPEKLNAITWDMWMQLSDHLSRIAAEPALRSVLLIGSGRGFCSGADVSGSSVSGVAGVRERLQTIQNIVLKLYMLDKPVVCAVRGAAVGVGWSLALACDMMIASKTAKFSQIFLNRGGAPDGGAIYLLARQIGEFRAKELVYSRRFVEADEALSLGLVNAVVEDDQLETVAFEKAAELAAGPTFGIGLAKEMFRYNAATLADFLRLELTCCTVTAQSEDAREGGAAFREKRAPNFIGR